jgi:hypothetical protein
MTWRVGTLKWGHENFGNFKVFFTNFGETSRSFGAGEASAEPSFDSMRHSLCWRAPSPRPPIPLSLCVQRARPWAGGGRISVSSSFSFFPLLLLLSNALALARLLSPETSAVALAHPSPLRRVPHPLSRASLSSPPFFVSDGSGIHHTAPPRAGRDLGAPGESGC